MSQGACEHTERGEVLLQPPAQEGCLECEASALGRLPCRGDGALHLNTSAQPSPAKSSSDTKRIPCPSVVEADSWLESVHASHSRAMRSLFRGTSAFDLGFRVTRGKATSKPRCLQGCGKTVEVLALVLSNPAPPQVVSGTVLRGLPYTKPLIESRCDNYLSRCHSFRLEEDPVKDSAGCST